MNNMHKKDVKNSDWFAIYTKSRHEKFVEQHLSKIGIEAYTPKAVIRKNWSDRIKKVKEPLFKSYCFAKFSLEDIKKITLQKGIVKVVNFGGNYIPVDEGIINSFKILESQEIELKPHPYLKQGDLVRIKSGPLQGVEGYILEKRKKDTELVICIDAIMSAAKCVIDITFIEPV